MKKVLILGAGLVAKPMVEYLLKTGYRLVIASPMKGRADEMINGNPMGASVDWSMDDPETLDLLVAGNDLVVSLLPYKYHPDVAKYCLRHKKPMVTTSYVKEEMQGFNEAAKNEGIIFLNEVGLDPGIDHMTAMKMIDLIHQNNGKVLAFYSICGALPAPEAADNPMRYKFSWSPKGVLLASLNSALYLKDGKEVLTDSENVFKDTFTLKFRETGELEVYPNRDSLSYIDIYGIPETKTMYRGTFRYKGWCETIDALKKLRMLDGTIIDYSGRTYLQFIEERVGMKLPQPAADIAKILNLPSDSAAVRSLEYLGFFSNETLPYYETTPFEITSDRMINLMMLGEDERDLVILQHILLAEWPGGKTEVIKSSMIDFGSPDTNTAISRTVALPAAISVRLILEGKISLAGVHRPVIPEIYNPILDELKNLGISMKEEYNLTESELPFN
jgi:saccharopine dehydrogenase-like NADP-dependent oxidoreductase